jgi:hypothetical protein
MNSKPRWLLASLFWHYLNQRVFDRHHPAIFNPEKFRHLHSVRYLERCLSKHHQPEEPHRH